jgi:DNA segregation ATPase FtsK/SpoIIIE-like protein
MSKLKKKDKSEDPFPISEVLGWGLFLGSFLCLLSLLGNFISQGNNHFLGPFLGNYLALILERTFGKLPLLLWVMMTGFVGLKVLFKYFNKVSWRNVFCFFLGALLLNIWLSLDHLMIHNLTRFHFVNSGGILGSFIIHFIFQPIFHESIIGARISLGLISFYYIILTFNISPARIIESLHKEKKKPQKKYRKSIAENLIEEKEQKKAAFKKENETNIAELNIPDNIDISKLTPLELRKYRDEKAQVSRVKELNQWEDKKPKKLKIGGILSKKENIEKTSAKNSGKTLKLSITDIHKIQKKEIKPYVIPNAIDVFSPVPVQNAEFDEESLINLSAQIEAQLSNFKVKGKVTGITTGPVITRFEIDLAPGVKVSKISGLSEDLALALRAKSVRILAPIPGKSAVGIEVPNPKSHIVYAKTVLESKQFDSSDEDKISIALGQDIAGQAYCMNLARAPHLLIAGQTGSGKSVCINTLMASLICSKSPSELRLILVDPKVVELKPYENIPHLLHPVVTDPEIAVQALQWACWEMDRRYDVLAQAKVRNLAGYNKKFRDGKLGDLVDESENKIMPFIIIMIDELADLMMVAGKDVEISIARIAQKARAVGIHLVLATQRPSTNVITGTIKANLPTRIAFKVASHIDARTIMDKAGAEKLLGRGDMFFKAIEDPEPIRVHGAFLSDEEVEELCLASSSQFCDVEQLESFAIEGQNGSNDEFDMGPRDEKFEDAAELVVANGQASASMFQRRLGVGYARAGKLIDQLESAGIVGPSKGSKARTVLMDEEELYSFLRGTTDDLVIDN